MGVPGGEKREKGPENVLEDIIPESFPTWDRKQTSRSRKHRDSQIGSTQRGKHQDIL